MRTYRSLASLAAIAILSMAATAFASPADSRVEPDRTSISNELQGAGVSYAMAYGRANVAVRGGVQSLEYRVVATRRGTVEVEVKDERGRVHAAGVIVTDEQHESHALHLAACNTVSDWHRRQGSGDEMLVSYDLASGTDKIAFNTSHRRAAAERMLTAEKARSEAATQASVATPSRKLLLL